MGTSGIFKDWQTTKTWKALSFPGELLVMFSLSPADSLGTGEHSKFVRPGERLSARFEKFYPWGPARVTTSQEFETLHATLETAYKSLKCVEVEGNRVSLTRHFEDQSHFESFIRGACLLLSPLITAKLKTPLSLVSILVSTTSKDPILLIEPKQVAALTLEAQHTDALVDSLMVAVTHFEDLGEIPNPIPQDWYVFLKALSFFQKALFLLEASGATDIFYSEVGLNLYLVVETIAQHLPKTEGKTPTHQLYEFFNLSNHDRDLISLLYKIRNELDWAHGGGRTVPFNEHERDAVANVIPMLVNAVSGLLEKCIELHTDKKLTLTPVTAKANASAQRIYDAIRKILEEKAVAKTDSRRVPFTCSVTLIR